MSFTKFFLNFMILSVLLEKTFKIHCLKKQQTASVLAMLAQHVKIDWNKKLDPKQKPIQALNIDAKKFRKTKNENPLT